jgi:hypothetical protein
MYTGTINTVASFDVKDRPAVSSQPKESCEEQTIFNVSGELFQEID